MGLTDADMSKAKYVFAAIFSLSNRWQTLGDRIDSTISLKQWFVLAIIANSTSKTNNLGDIAKSYGTSRQNIKKIAIILEKKGFLSLKKDPNDKRSLQLTLTEKCYEYLKSRHQQEALYFMSVFSDVDKEIIESLYEGTKKLIENTDKIMD